jgi:hypothetical protein
MRIRARRRHPRRRRPAQLRRPPATPRHQPDQGPRRGSPATRRLRAAFDLLAIGGVDLRTQRWKSPRRPDLRPGDPATRKATLAPATPLLEATPYRIVVAGVRQDWRTLAPIRSVFSNVDVGRLWRGGDDQVRCGSTTRCTPGCRSTCMCGRRTLRSPRPPTSLALRLARLTFATNGVAQVHHQSGSAA